jgi:hypothetical protein
MNEIIICLRIVFVNSEKENQNQNFSDGAEHKKYAENLYKMARRYLSGT